MDEVNKKGKENSKKEVKKTADVMAVSTLLRKVLDLEKKLFLDYYGFEIGDKNAGTRLAKLILDNNILDREEHNLE